VPDTSIGKRRRGSSRQSQRSAPRSTSGGVSSSRSTAPVGGASVSSRVPGIPWLVGGAIVLVVLVGAFLVFRPGSGGGGTGSATASGSPNASPAASQLAGASGSTAPGTGNGSCPTKQPDPLPAGQTRTVTLTTPKGTMAIKVEADLSPIAAGNFVALASCGYYDGTVFHRTATLQDGTPFVIQGGDPTGTGTGGPGYTIKDEPVKTEYKRGTVAMARTSQPDSVGSQFFIVLDDKDGEILKAYNTYQIIGNVTSGMETADAIYAASGGKEQPTNPIPITTATVTNP
jgi:peptidyl-prolyl cis-trans isomerase B (cyclophilin B)